MNIQLNPEPPQKPDWWIIPALAFVIIVLSVALTFIIYYMTK